MSVERRVGGATYRVELIDLPKTSTYPGRTMVCLTKITNKVSKLWISERDWDDVAHLISKFDAARLSATSPAADAPDPEPAQ